MDLLTEKDIIVLLGAGASAEAGIPFTTQMIHELEQSLSEEEPNNKQLKQLYNFLNDQKKLQSTESITIEELVNVIDELCLLMEKKHPLTLINLSWINFMENLGYNNDLLKSFKVFIFNKLKKWIPIEDKQKPKYYNSIGNFLIEYDYKLSIFTLNYDRCIEDYCNEVENKDPQKNNGKPYNIFIERGFGNEKETDENKIWDYKKFIGYEDSTERKIYLYKMHGSIDWERNIQDKTERKNNISNIEIFDIIFGTQQKVKAYDPYLFFLYEFREKSLNSKIIIICGYGFGDEHINKILRQAYETGKDKPYLLINVYNVNESERKQEISKKLHLTTSERIIIHNSKASDFFKNKLTVESIKSILYPDGDDSPF
jgi:hypothetical protein